MPNLFVAHELSEPERDDQAVSRAIEGLGRPHRLQRSLYFVRTTASLREATDAVAPALGADDKLVVIEAVGAFIHNYTQTVIDALGSA